MNLIKFFNKFLFYRSLSINEKINFKIQVYEAKKNITDFSM